MINGPFSSKPCLTTKGTRSPPHLASAVREQNLASGNDVTWLYMHISCYIMWLFIVFYDIKMYPMMLYSMLFVFSFIMLYSEMIYSIWKRMHMAHLWLHRVSCSNSHQNRYRGAHGPLMVLHWGEVWGECSILLLYKCSLKPRYPPVMTNMANWKITTFNR